MNSTIGICQGCHVFRVNNPQPQLPALWSETNELDPGEPPEHLDALRPLTPVVGWLIACVHTRMQVMTYRRAQYKYCGHIISFPKNVSTMHHRLPVPPGQLNFPRNQTDQSIMINGFRTQPCVRRPVVVAWLRHLQANHDRYSDVTIDEYFLSQLPDDVDVNADLQTEDVDPADLEDVITEIGMVILSRMR
ncbi:hypothetical protein E4U58_004422 [Claviceps cyperi]|nr:hypothetical protein E4U58_004422 [Claviceps cyperi]